MTVEQSAFSIPTEVNMSTSQVFDMINDSEHLEVEGVIKLNVDEKQLPKLQNIYETDKDTEEDPLDEDDAFEQLPPREQRIYKEMADFQRELRQHRLACCMKRNGYSYCHNQYCENRSYLLLLDPFDASH